jgi:hypothetical protein
MRFQRTIGYAVQAAEIELPRVIGAFDHFSSSFSKSPQLSSCQRLNPTPTSLDPAHRPKLQHPPTKPPLQAVGNFRMVTQPLPGPEHFGLGPFFQPFGQRYRAVLDDAVGVIQ